QSCVCRGAKVAKAKRREIKGEDEITQIVEETAAKYHPHKFRATYCTKLLQSGIDLNTVQKLMGHKTIESTMRYLAKAQSHVVKAKVDAVQWKKARPATVSYSQCIPIATPGLLPRKRRPPASWAHNALLLGLRTESEHNPIVLEEDFNAQRNAV